MRLCTLIAAMVFAGPALAAPPDISQVNGTISVDASQQAGDVSTTNGSIHIGARASVADVHSVNGGITVEDGASATSVETVNGGIHLQRDVRINGAVSTVNGAVQLNAARAASVTTVNGSVTLDPSADVSGRVTTVNGAVHVNASHVGGGIETVAHDIDIGADSRVEGGILVRKREESWIRQWFPEHNLPPRIVIGPGAVVTGTLRFQCPVKLYVSDHARIGAVEGATAIAFSGEQPPA